MAQQFKVIINAGKDENAQTLQAEQGAGQRGRPLIIKAVGLFSKLSHFSHLSRQSLSHVQHILLIF